MTGIPFEDAEGWAHRRYRFDVVVDGAPALFGVEYRAALESADPPDPTRMVEDVLEDVAQVQG
ncbi:MAG: hypothetical protein LC790_17190, partial [Actinobacteria bacterium]|nr:hypothetical protein [Actinomycetota bacterium]